jgi:methylaspartate mutase sigma subunit
MSRQPLLTRPGAAAPIAGRLRVLVSGLESDAHTWNLVYVAMVVREAGHEVVNLGPCVSPAELVRACEEQSPHVAVLSTVNGHGLDDGLRAIRALRRHPSFGALPVVIGGKLSTSGGDRTEPVSALLTGGFDGVFLEGAELDEFRSYLGLLASRRAS